MRFSKYFPDQTSVFRGPVELSCRAENHDAREHGRAGQDRPRGHHAAQHQAAEEGQHCGLSRQLPRQILQSKGSFMRKKL